MSIEGKVQKVIRSTQQKIEDIISLDFTGLKIGKITPSIKKIIQKCINLQYLILCQCGLVNLDNLPTLPKLTNLDLSINSLPDQEIRKLEIYRQLIVLNLAENGIKRLDTITGLTFLKKLERLELMDNQIEKLPDYSIRIFKTFGKLECLDGKDQNGKDTDYDYDDKIMGMSDEMDSDDDEDADEDFNPYGEEEEDQPEKLIAEGEDEDEGQEDDDEDGEEQEQQDDDDSEQPELDDQENESKG